MKAILLEFARTREQDDHIKWVTSRLGRLLSSVAKGSVLSLGKQLGVDGRAVLDEFTPDADPGADLKMIRTEFTDLVREMTTDEKTGAAGRVVVFIDDLDRVRPARAVAMLEIVKNFMDVERCVFVVACDYDVVQQGVKDRSATSR